MSNTFMEFPPREYFKSTGNKTYDILKENIDRLEREGLEYAIWGAGYSGRATRDTIEKYTGKPSAEKYIIDNNKQVCDGKHTLTPNQFIIHMSEIDTVFICVYVADLVREQLANMGYKGNMVPMVRPDVVGDQFIANEMTWYDDYKDLYEMVADEQSRQTIINWLMAGANGDMSLYEEINGSSHFKLVEKDILHTGENEIFIDIGAFIGDTIAPFLETANGRYNSILAIEADPINYRGLLNTVAEMENINCINAACGRENGETNFLQNSESGAIGKEGGIVVQMKALDKIPEAQNATMIKISANGYEYPIIEGAREIITKNKPKLSYYCGASEKWIIPKLLKEMVPEYKFYIRHYGYGWQALVGYAVCENAD